MDSSEPAFMNLFKSRKPFLTTPNKKNSRFSVGPSVPTPERVSPSPLTLIRNQNFTLSISDVRRTAFRFGNSDIAHLDATNGSDNSTHQLPEKYEMLYDFFIAMINTIRLLRLRGVPGTLSKLGHKIESLTDRRFTVHHLAKLKYILPEVIVVKKTRVEDEKTKCMVEELVVSLEMDAVEYDKNAEGGDRFSQLKKIFRSRIIDCFETHLEDDDIPEGELPHLFNQQQNKESEQIMNQIPSPLASSLAAPSFKRRFSTRSRGAPVFESKPTTSSSCLCGTIMKEATSVEATDGSCTAVEADVAPLHSTSTPAKFAVSPSKLASTPAELASTPARLMAVTPAACTRKQTLMSPDHDTSFLTRKTAKSLKFNKNRVDEEDIFAPAQGSMNKDDLSQSLNEKEQRILEEKDLDVSNGMRRQQMMNRVPKLFDMIRLLFQSIKRTAITKEELIYKLLVGNLDIVDKSEVEEQLKLLQELTPEFICEKLSISGDTLVSLNKWSCPDSTRAKLLEANETKMASRILTA